MSKSVAPTHEERAAGSVEEASPKATCSSTAPKESAARNLLLRRLAEAKADALKAQQSVAVTSPVPPSTPSTTGTSPLPAASHRPAEKKKPDVRALKSKIQARLQEEKRRAEADKVGTSTIESASKVAEAGLRKQLLARLGR